MLIRRGTIVRKPSTRKSSVRRTRSAGSAYSGGSLHGRQPPEEDSPHRAEVNSVPPSPVAKLHHVYVDPATPSSSPGKASVATTNSTIVVSHLQLVLYPWSKVRSPVAYFIKKKKNYVSLIEVYDLLELQLKTEKCI